MSTGPTLASRPKIATAQVTNVQPRQIARLHVPAPALRKQLAVKVRRVVPANGEVVFTLLPHGETWAPGTTFSSDCDPQFWVASESHIIRDIDEWLNSEYEWICDQFYEVESDQVAWEHPAGDGRTLGPTVEQCLDAWDSVAHGEPDATVAIEVCDADGTPVGMLAMTQGELIAHYGLGEASINPTVVIAEELLESDWTRILDEDGDCYLDGYEVRRCETTDDIQTVYIAPPK